MNSWRVSKDSTLIMFLLWIFLSLVLLLPRRAPAPFPMRNQIKGKGDGRKTESVLRGWWECSLAAISQTTIHMHGHHEATMGLAGVSLGRELRALALSHTASVRRVAPPENSVTNSRADCALTQQMIGCIKAI